MVSSGILMMLRALGIEVNPQEIVDTVQTLAKNVAEMHASQRNTEAMVQRLLEIHEPKQERQSQDGTHTALVNGRDESKLSLRDGKEG